MPSFSALDRNDHLNELASTAWDLVIIGGGITGAGILLDAVSRGMKAALVEKRDFAWGTSSRSTKLIHGGLRYLKQLEINLVREVGRERAIVHRNARHVVRPERMILPMYKNGTLGKVTGSVGLWLYDFLADVGPDERRRMISPEEILELEPILKKDGLTGGAVYYEYRTDDARLTIENLKTAATMGGLALNYCECTDFEYEDGKISGLRCIDNETGIEISISTRAVINAAGPWVDNVRSLEPEENQSKLFLTNGLHIVIPQSKLPLTNSLYFDTEVDDRMIFAITREDHVYIGTTDIAFEGSPDTPEATEGEMQYLLDAVNGQFPGIKLTRADIVSTWSGLRPLIFKEGKSPTDLSRKDEIFVSDTGLISIAGGKLTGYRKMAERVIDRLSDIKKLELGDCKTAEIVLSGCGTSSEEEHAAERQSVISEASALGIPERIAAKWHLRYGTAAFDVIANVKSKSGHSEIDEDACLIAEVDHCIEHEMVRTAHDFGLLRTSMVHFESDKWSRTAPAIEAYIKSKLGI